MVTIKDVEKRLEQYKRMELAGISQPDLDLGPAMILWTKDRSSGKEHWEILPEWLAELVVSDLHNQNVARAILYRKPPESAPLNIVVKWVQQRITRR